MSSQVKFPIPLFATIFVFAIYELASAQEYLAEIVDVPRVVAAKDVTPRSYPNESRVIELVLSPSTRIHESVCKGKILRLNYLVETAFSIADYLPSTTMTTSFADDIKVSTSVSNYDGRIFYSVSPILGEVKLSLNSAASDVKYRLLPPLDTLVESGFRSKGRGASFTFRDSNQTTLAGRKDIAILLRIPKNFQADYLTLRVTGELEQEKYAWSTTAMVKHTFEDEFDIAYYLDTASNSVDLRKEAELFVENKSVSEAATTLNEAINKLEKDKSERTFTSSPKHLSVAVSKAKSEYESSRTAVRNGFRAKYDAAATTK